MYSGSPKGVKVLPPGAGRTRRAGLTSNSGRIGIGNGTGLIQPGGTRDLTSAESPSRSSTTERNETTGPGRPPPLDRLTADIQPMSCLSTFSGPVILEHPVPARSLFLSLRPVSCRTIHGPDPKRFILCRNRQPGSKCAVTFGCGVFKRDVHDRDIRRFTYGHRRAGNAVEGWISSERFLLA